MPRASLLLLLISNLGFHCNGGTIATEDGIYAAVGSRLNDNSMATRRTHSNVNANINSNTNVVHLNEGGNGPEEYEVQLTGTTSRYPEEQQEKHDPRHTEYPYSTKYTPEFDPNYDEYETGNRPESGPENDRAEVPEVPNQESKELQEEPESDSDESASPAEGLEKQSDSEKENKEVENESGRIKDDKDNPRTCICDREYDQRYHPGDPDVTPDENSWHQPSKQVNSNINTNVIFKSKARRFLRNNLHKHLDRSLYRSRWLPVDDEDDYFDNFDFDHDDQRKSAHRGSVKNNGDSNNNLPFHRHGNYDAKSNVNAMDNIRQRSYHINDGYIMKNRRRNRYSGKPKQMIQIWLQ